MLKKTIAIAITITATSVKPSSSFNAVATSLTAPSPCTATSRISNCTSGQRSLALTTTSCIAALARPQIKPILVGRNGNACFFAASNNPSAAKVCFNASNRASNSPMPTGLIAKTRSCSSPRRGQISGCSNNSTRSPSTKNCASAPSTDRVAAVETETSVCKSRNVAKITCEPGRSLTSASCPSTQTAGSFFRYSFSRLTTSLTGTACCGSAPKFTS